MRSYWTRLLRRVWSDRRIRFGRSAARRVGGRRIAAATTLFARDRGIPAPSALVLISPATDLACTGTRQDASSGDYLETQRCSRATSVCAEPRCATRCHPPHGTSPAGFPATLIQAGTRERLLSDSVRLHRALRARGPRFPPGAVRRDAARISILDGDTRKAVPLGRDRRFLVSSLGTKHNFPHENLNTQETPAGGQRCWRPVASAPVRPSSHAGATQLDHPRTVDRGSNQLPASSRLCGHEHHDVAEESWRQPRAMAHQFPAKRI